MGKPKGFKKDSCEREVDKREASKRASDPAGPCQQNAHRGEKRGDLGGERDGNRSQTKGGGGGKLWPSARFDEPTDGPLSKEVDRNPTTGKRERSGGELKEKRQGVKQVEKNDRGRGDIPSTK